MRFVVLRPNINQEAANVFKEHPWNHTTIRPPTPTHAHTHQMSSRYYHLPPPSLLSTH